MRHLLHATGIFLVLLLGLAAIPAWGQTPATTEAQPKTSGDEDIFIYRTPIANAGMVQVFLGAAGRYIRTTPFHLKDFKLDTDGARMVVSADIALREAEKTLLEGGVQTHVSREANAPKPVKVGLTWITPHTVKVVLIGPDGKTKLGEGIQGGGPNPLQMDDTVPFTLVVPLIPSITDRSKIGDYRVKFDATYKVRVSETQYAAFQIITSEATSSLEKILGRKPDPGDFITRQTTQSVANSNLVKGSLVLINARPGDANLVAAMLRDSIAEPRTLDNTNWDKLPSKWFIWTPELGRLEIAPTEKRFEEVERATKQSYKSAFMEKAKSLFSEAKRSGDFATWYDVRHKKRQDIGSASGSLDTEMKIFEINGGASHGTAAYSFDKRLEDLDVASGERARYEELYKTLQNESEVLKNAESNFEEYWRGHNQMIDYVAKKFDLAAVRDASSTTEKLVEVTRRILGDLEDRTYSSQEFPLSQATIMVDSIAELQKELRREREERIAGELVIDHYSVPVRHAFDLIKFTELYNYFLFDLKKGREGMKNLVIVPTFHVGAADGSSQTIWVIRKRETP